MLGNGLMVLKVCIMEIYMVKKILREDCLSFAIKRSCVGQINCFKTEIENNNIEYRQK